MKRPNVLLLYTDQQRWDALGASGNPYIHTPNLDRLASRGALFENAFCNAPVCMPSRQSMLSGQYPSVVGCTCNGIEMREDALTVQRVLRANGYCTAQIGKLHFLNHSNRDHRELHPSYGFDHMLLSDEPGCYEDAYIKWVEMHDPAAVALCQASTPPAWTGDPVEAEPRNTHEPYLFRGPETLTHTAFVAEECISFIEQHRGGPFFVIGGFYAPHTPLNPPKRFVDMYDIDSLPLPHMNPGENRLGLSKAAWRRVKAYYYALVSHVDDQVGRILDALARQGRADDTLVLFTSDHGEHLGDHGRIQKGAPGYDSCSHVPLLMCYAGGFAGGQRHSGLVECVDIVPTILDYCGIQTPPQMQGRSLRPLLDGKGYEERQSVFIEHRFPFGASWKTVRTDHYKLCVSGDGRRELYDLRNDPHELCNVAADERYDGTLADMRAELVRRWFDVESQYPLRTGQY